MPQLGQPGGGVKSGLPGRPGPLTEARIMDITHRAGSIVRGVEEPRALRLREIGIKGQRVYIGFGDGRYGEFALVGATTPTATTTTPGPIYGSHTCLLTRLLEYDSIHLQGHIQPLQK